ncbi:MAG: DNA-protecting protein DprA [Verrucomicrobiales bacterium]|nr:DNA-protecting protein DprA [Verrucomicrobiales bacterium]
MQPKELSPEQLVGPLNEVERKFAPKRLFIAGDESLVRDRTRVAIVGSRKASADGLRRARKLAGLLAERGIVVVSGLAEGIDTAAHTACIEKSGRTVAVLGTPLDDAFPKSNASLQERIAAEHLCVTQFPSGSPVQRKNFPMRNRTMALISDATVIIEASESSGSLSQGWEALRLGRALFITKTVAEDPSLKWPAEMLSYGARVLSNDAVDDFFAMLPERSALAVTDGAPF